MSASPKQIPSKLGMSPIFQIPGTSGVGTLGVNGPRVSITKDMKKLFSEKSPPGLDPELKDSSVERRLHADFEDAGGAAHDGATLTELPESGEDDAAGPGATGATPASARSTGAASPVIDDIEEVTHLSAFKAFADKHKLQGTLDVLLDSTWFVHLCRGEALREFQFHTMQDVSAEDRRMILVPLLHDVATTIITHDKSRKNRPNKWRPTGTDKAADSKKQAKYHAYLDERQRSANAIWKVLNRMVRERSRDRSRDIDNQPRVRELEREVTELKTLLTIRKIDGKAGGADKQYYLNKWMTECPAYKMGQEEAYHIWHDNIVSTIEESFNPAIQISQLLAKLPREHSDALKILRTAIKIKYEQHIASGKLATDPYDDGSQTQKDMTFTDIAMYGIEFPWYLRSSEHILARQHTGAGQAFSRRAGGAECAALRN